MRSPEIPWGVHAEYDYRFVSIRGTSGLSNNCNLCIVELWGVESSSSLYAAAKSAKTGHSPAEYIARFRWRLNGPSDLTGVFSIGPLQENL